MAIFQKRALTFLGIILMPTIWLLVKFGFNISDRYLPSPIAVLKAFGDIQPNFVIHFMYSLGRLLIGMGGGIVLGVFGGLQLFKRNTLNALLIPTVQSIRSIPAAATVPFFLLWFGFSDIGKFLLIFLGIAFNLAIATLEILNHIPEKYQIMFASFKRSPKQYILKFCVPFVAEKIQPTIRFSLSTAIGLVVISELLGSQIGPMTTVSKLNKLVCLEQF